MKKTVWAAVAIVATVAMIPIAAQGLQGRGGAGQGRGFGGPGGPGGPGGQGGRGGPMAILNQLNLTDQQQEQIKAIHQERRNERPGADMMELQKQLQTAIFADTVDIAKIEGIKTGIASAEAAMLSARVDTEVKISQLLTPQQRAKARELFAKGPPRGRRGQ